MTQETWGPKIPAMSLSRVRGQPFLVSWGLMGRQEEKPPFSSSAYANAIKPIRMIALISELGCPGRGKWQGHPFHSAFTGTLCIPAFISLYLIRFYQRHSNAEKEPGNFKACFCLGSLAPALLCYRCLHPAR